MANTAFLTGKMIGENTNCCYDHYTWHHRKQNKTIVSNNNLAATNIHKVWFQKKNHDPFPLPSTLEIVLEDHKVIVL